MFIMAEKVTSSYFHGNKTYDIYLNASENIIIIIAPMHLVIFVALIYRDAFYKILKYNMYFCLFKTNKFYRNLIKGQKWTMEVSRWNLTAALLHNLHFESLLGLALHFETLPLTWWIQFQKRC